MLLTLLATMTTLYLAAAGAGLILRRWPTAATRLVHALAAAGAVAGLVLALGGLGGADERLDLGPLTPFARLAWRLDPLAAFFLLLIALAGLAAAVYALGHVRPVAGRAPTTLLVGLPIFLAAMSLVPLAHDAFLFLLLWETMSLASYFLVVNDHGDERVRRAGFAYLVMTHFATAAIMLAFLLLAGAGGAVGLDLLRAAGPTLPPLARDAVFVLALIGFGTKAGLAPLHVWLPRAHPVAPSHVSALMSGVMIKTGIYGLLRVGWDLLGPGPAWWGVLLIVVGAASAVLGVLYAAVEGDLKRLLAFSTVENAGLIAVGLGVALIGRGLDLAPLAWLGLAAALLHALNHALFKTLLFLGAGAVLHATHTRRLDRLGGLLRRMPITGGLMLLGLAALAALPPLNGFASEWSLIQSLIGLASIGNGWLGVLAAVALAAVALAGALALATGVKAFGVAFLGLARTGAATRAHEASASMWLPMAGLALACVGLGLVPTPGLAAASGVARALGVPIAPVPMTSWANWVYLGAFRPTTGAILGPDVTISPLVIGLVLVLLAPLPWLLLRWLAGPVARRVDEVWVCGEALTPRMQYTSSSFSKAIRLMFQAIIRPVRTVEQRFADGYFLQTMTYRGETRPAIERYLYATLHAGVLALARATRVIQNGSTRWYLTYIFVTLVILLLVAR